MLKFHQQRENINNIILAICNISMCWEKTLVNISYFDNFRLKEKT